MERLCPPRVPCLVCSAWAFYSERTSSIPTSSSFLSSSFVMLFNQSVKYWAFSELLCFSFSFLLLLLLLFDLSLQESSHKLLAQKPLQLVDRLPQYCAKQTQIARGYSVRLQLGNKFVKSKRKESSWPVLAGQHLT